MLVLDGDIGHNKSNTMMKKFAKIRRIDTILQKR